jgi:carbonic anhydrase
MPTGAARMMVEQAMGSIVRRGACADSVETVACAHIVETGLGLLERSPVIARRVDAGRCGIVCATTSSDDGRLRAYATVGAVGEISDSLMECV